MDLQRIALLIDADNTQIGKIEAVIREVSKHGRIVVKRAYGNWKKDVLKNWEDETKRLAIKAVQQFDYVTGKNATDMALVIDTIDLLHSGIYDAFALVASDSDYTPLAIKLRESGVIVMGFGEKKTPEAFRNSCDEFIFLENLDLRETDAHAMPPSLERREDVEDIHDLLKIASDTYQEDNGYTNVCSANDYIKRTKPEFDVRTYGFKKLPEMLMAFPKKYQVTRYPGKGTVTIVAYKCL